ncbi:MAG TPA: Smr/MutS family protein [Candidatus Cryptobacteroides merdipullorum]|uniref:Endonuclease MutS2 n=1 Tax=Candidatus Cryptobacteroides merdipullorum TaxID=2840771 RepID=A0A9D1GNU4_9BACT|nr:Smr/MutS family protein [Candidatus Cryptobacteroides merdipullorum]
MKDQILEAKIGFDKIRRIISDRCLTDYAVERVAGEEFSNDAAVIGRRLRLTDEMRLVMMFEENFPTTGYIDTPFLDSLAKPGSCIDVLSLGKLKTATDTIRRILHFFGSVKDGVYPELKRLAGPVRTFPEIQRRIESILDKYGDIKDSASDRLMEIRGSIHSKEAAISKRAGAILRQAQEAGISDSDASVNIRDGKFLIPVSSSAKRKLPGFVYDESASGKTTFIEPAEIIELENEISALHFEEAREIQKILYDFTEFLRPYIPELLKGAEFLGETDFLMAKAQTALDFIAGMPVISADGSLNLRKARHPLLEKALKAEGREMIPLTITLTPGKRILLISGPNAGGKSVCLKTTGLLQYMFQWGMLVPTSETSELPIFDRISVSIGDNQNIENDLSTYSSFLADMRDMLAAADDRTLVLIDEFGSGTEPAAGGAIAEAILAEMDKRGVYGVITTHYTNLKLYASSQGEHVTNGAMLYDSSRIEPMFKLEIGLPGNSFAFELARKMKLPEPIVKDAENRAGDEFVGMERNLRKIARNRRALDEKLQKVKHSDKALTELTERYEKELEDIRRLRESILADARREAEEIVRGAGSRVERTIREIREAQAEKEQTRAARQELQNFLGGLEQKKLGEQKKREEYIDRKLSQLQKRKKKKEAAAQKEQKQEPLKVGEKVRIKDNGLVGEVSKISSRSVTLIIGNVTSTMSPDKVERISSNEFREATRRTFGTPVQKVDSSITERKLNFSPELDIRGERLSDALNTVMHYIDDAIMLNVGMVRIIHGKGTGVLREEIQKYLRSVPGLTVSDEDIRNGGTGVTIVKF